MNIVVRRYDGSIECRPDTTMERENKDLYFPDFVTGLDYSPVLFARISKAGKFIGEKFAGRYYDAINYGILLYPELCFAQPGMLGPSGANVESWTGVVSGVSLMDRTSLLPSPLYNRVTLENGTNVFSFMLDGKEIYSTTCGSEQIIEKALVGASTLVSLRIGDLVAVELEPAQRLMEIDRLEEGEKKKAAVRATFCENELFDLNIF